MSLVMAPSAITTEQYTPLSIKTITPVERNAVDNYGVKYAKDLIGEAFRTRVETLDHDNCEAGEEDAFFVADMGEVYRQHLRWKMNLKRVKPHYGTLLPVYHKSTFWLRTFLWQFRSSKPCRA